MEPNQKAVCSWKDSPNGVTVLSKWSVMRASISNTCDHKQTFNRNDIMSHTTEMAPYAPLWVVIKTHYYLDSCNYPNSKVYTLGGVDHDVSTSTTSAGVLPAPMKDRRNRLLRTEPHRPQRQYTTLILRSARAFTGCCEWHHFNVP